MIVRRGSPAAVSSACACACACALVLATPLVHAQAQSDTAPAAAQAHAPAEIGVAPAQTPPAAPEPLWVPDPEETDAVADDAERDATVADPLDAQASQLPAASSVAPLDAAAGGALRVAIAHWMASGAQAAGLPGELPVMAALVESGLRNLPYGDRDSVGYFQMRVGIWNRGPYEGYLARPELQLRWFVDHALAVRDARRAAGDADFGEDPATWGRWIADVERPAARYRGRYQLRLAEARALLATSAPPLAPFEHGLAVGAPVLSPGAPDAAARRVLQDDRIALSALAREDLQAGRIDPRLSAVLTQAAQIAPLAVSVFQSGHSYLTVHGTVSNHSFGRGVDISAVGGAPVGPGNEDARAVALALARLPREIRPTEIGTPWPIDDPAYFTDAGHQDHLHVAFDAIAALPSGAVRHAAVAVTRAVATSPPRPVRAAAPTEPHFDAVTRGRASEDRDPAEPRFEVREAAR